MTSSIIVQPFAPYIRQYFASLESEIAEWLALFDKTMEDVDEWTLHASLRAPGRYRMHITLSFDDSEEKHVATFMYYAGEVPRERE